MVFLDLVFEDTTVKGGRIVFELFEHTNPHAAKNFAALCQGSPFFFPVNIS